ncbi:hypothetical protein C6P45_000331 [Maudiozyma exigua]|uniref:Uncharacterized protein n=1 Tax=Maudiozyma exigua TaxID=34358 RepID=A0A9P6W709_MAUEX|nr:hypothetical protein C6P45_000331 [Kazachstania exigua]
MPFLHNKNSEQASSIRRHSHRRTFSSEAAAAAAAVSNGSLSRSESLVRCKSAPRQTYSFSRASSIRSSPDSRRSPTRLDRAGNYTRTFSTSVIPNNYEINETIDANLAFDGFDGGQQDIIDDINYSTRKPYHRYSRSIPTMRSQSQVMVEKYIPGPNGLSVVQVPVTVPVSNPTHKSRSNSMRVASSPSPVRSSENLQTKKSNPASPLKRHGAVRRSKIIHTPEEAPSSQPDSPKPIVPIPEKQYKPPKDFRTTYEDGENIIEKTVRTKATKDHGSIETTTIIRRHTKRANKENNRQKLDSSKRNIPENKINNSDNILKLREEVQKSELEKQLLESKLEKIKSAERDLATKKERESVQEQGETKDTSEDMSLSGQVIPKRITSFKKPHTKHEKLKGPLRVIKSHDTNDSSHNIETDSEDEITMDNDHGDMESTSIMSSINDYHHLSTIQSIDIEQSRTEDTPLRQDLSKSSPKQETPRLSPRKYGTASDTVQDSNSTNTSNQDIKILNNKLNAFLDKEMLDGKNEHGNDPSYESLLLDIYGTESVQGVSSNFNSKSSLHINDSQISVVPSLDLGHDSNKTMENNHAESKSTKPSMAQYLKASHPYLSNSDDETDDLYRNGIPTRSRNASDGTNSHSHIDSTLSINIPQSQVPNSSYTSMDSQSKADRIWFLPKSDIVNQDENYTNSTVNTNNSNFSKREENDSHNTGTSSSVDVPGGFKNNIKIGKAGLSLDSFKSESSSVYSYQPVQNNVKTHQRVIGLDNLDDTLGEYNNTKVPSDNDKNLVLKKRKDRGRNFRGHKVSQSVDLAVQKSDNRRKSEKLSAFNGQGRSKSLTRRLSLQTAIKNINNIENETYKKHSRNSSFGKSLKKIFGIHSK